MLVYADVVYQGYFSCKGCGYPLYSAQSKFADSGWDAFSMAYISGEQAHVAIRGFNEVSCVYHYRDWVYGMIWFVLTWTSGTRHILGLLCQLWQSSGTSLSHTGRSDPTASVNQLHLCCLSQGCEILARQHHGRETSFLWKDQVAQKRRSLAPSIVQYDTMARNWRTCPLGVMTSLDVKPIPEAWGRFQIFCELFFSMRMTVLRDGFGFAYQRDSFSSTWQ